MSYSNGIISAPVSIADVKAVLGESSNDLGTLCKSEKINIWSKHKPTRWTQMFRNTAPSAIRTQWWLGVDSDYNIKIPSYVYKDLNMENILNQQVTIKRPSGGSSYPYRLADFEGYCHTPDWSKTNGISKLIDIGLDTDNIPLPISDGSVSVSLRPSAYVDDKTINFFEAYLPKNQAYFGFLFCIKVGTSVSGSTDEYIYRIVTTTIPYSEIPVSSAATNINKTASNGESYQIGYVVQPASDIISLAVILHKNLFQQYMDYPFRAIPIVANAVCSWETIESTTRIYPLIIQGSGVGNAAVNLSKSFTIDESTTFVEPKITITLNDLSVNSASCRISAMHLKLSLTEDNDSRFTAYLCDHIQIVVYGYNSSAKQYIYVADKDVSINKDVTLGYVAGSGTSFLLDNKDFSLSYSTSYTKFKVVVTAFFKLKYNGTVFYDSIEKIV